MNDPRLIVGTRWRKEYPKEARDRGEVTLEPGNIASPSRDYKFEFSVSDMDCENQVLNEFNNRTSAPYLPGIPVSRIIECHCHKLLSIPPRKVGPPERGRKDAKTLILDPREGIESLRRLRPFQV